MLVLTRRIGEEVVLPDVRVRFTVLSAGAGRVRIGVIAPAAVTVLRGELSGDARSESELQNVKRRGKRRPADRV